MSKLETNTYHAKKIETYHNVEQKLLENHKKVVQLLGIGSPELTQDVHSKTTNEKSDEQN